MSSSDSTQENPLHVSVEVGGSAQESSTVASASKVSKQQATLWSKSTTKQSYLDISFNPDEKFEYLGVVDEIWANEIPIEETYKQNRLVGW
jgi:hypothetical protein